MPTPDDLSPAAPEDLRQAIGYALRFNRSGKAHRLATDDMTRLAADMIASHLERCGFVVLRKPPAQAPRADYAHPAVPLKP